MDAIVFASAALYVGLAVWVFLDATERGFQPVAWGLVMIFLGWTVVPLLIYLAMRKPGQQVEVPPDAGWRQYLYTGSLTGLWLTAAGASTALGTVLYRAAAGEAMTDGQRWLLASGIAAAVVGAAVWQAHWLAAESRLARTGPDDQFRAWFSLRRVTLLTTVAVSGLVTAFAGLEILTAALMDAFDVPGASAATWAPPIAPFVIVGAVGAYHVLLVRRSDSGPAANRFGTIPAPPPTAKRAAPLRAAPPAPAPPPRVRRVPGRYGTMGRSFCPDCGTAVTQGDVFCGRCGSALTAPIPDENRQDQARNLQDQARNLQDQARSR